MGSLIENVKNEKFKEIEPILKKIKFSILGKTAVILTFDECETLMNYFYDLNTSIYILEDVICDLQSEYDKLGVYAYFLEGHNKSLRNDKARSDKKGV